MLSANILQWLERCAAGPTERVLAAESMMRRRMSELSSEYVSAGFASASPEPELSQDLYVASM